MADRPPRRYRIETLGCKANLYDSQHLAEALEALGFCRADGDEAADLCIVNSCTVTAVADRKSRQLASRLARENPGARVFVTGCYAQGSPAEAAAVEGVEGAYGRGEWAALLEDINGAPLPDRLAGAGGDFGISTFEGRVRAFLKIQEGCDFFCSYCILPHVRGKPRSRPLADVAAEARRLADAGFPEIVLTGIHVGLYGRDLADRPSVAQAILAVAETPGVSRVRLSSIEPNEVDAELLDALQHPAACPHLHLPLQSGDADVLRRMNRRYTPDEFRAAAGLARERLDRPAITTDVIVGFPGETDAGFANTLAFCREIAFSRLHVFPFSPRPGTPAAEMDGRVPALVAQERSRRLRDLGDAMTQDWAGSFVGEDVRCLFERVTPEGMLAGYTDRYVPLTAPGPAGLVGSACNVRCTAREGSALMGQLDPSERREP